MLALDGGYRRPTPPAPKHVAAPPPAPKRPAPQHAAAPKHAAPAKHHVAVGRNNDGFEGTLAHGSFEHGVAALSRKGSFSGKHLSGSGEVNALHASVGGRGRVTADLRHGRLGADGSISARANLIDARGQLTAHSPLGETKLTGHGNVGAEANASGSVAFDPRHGTVDASAHADAFAGARAGVGISHKVGPVSGRAGVEGEAGIGVNFDADAGFKKGKLEAHLNVGAALGLGVDFNVGGSVDLGGAAKGAEHLASGAVHGAEHLASKGWHAVTSIF